MFVTVKDQANRDIRVELTGPAERRFNDLFESMQPLARTIGIDTVHGSAFGRDSVQDSTEAFYFMVSQLAYTEAKIYARKYQPMQYETLLPLDFSAGEWVDSIRYETSDGAGEAEDLNMNSDDVPEVAVEYGNKIIQVPYAGIGYSYSLEELRRSAFLKRPLSETKMAWAIEAYKRKINKTALTGNAAKNLTGLYNNASVTHATRPSGQTWATSMAAATQDKVISDINYGLKTAWAATQFNTIPNTIVVAPLAYSELLAPRAANSDKSVLQWVLENNLAKQNGVDLKIIPGYGLDTAGASSSGRAVFYNKDEDNLVMHIPMPLRFIAPQQIGLKIKVPGEFKYSGVEIRRTPTVYYMDGIA